MRHLLWLNDTPIIVVDPRCSLPHLMFVYRNLVNVGLFEDDDKLLEEYIVRHLAGSKLNGQPGARLYWESRIKTVTMRAERLREILPAITSWHSTSVSIPDTKFIDCASHPPTSQGN